MPLNKTFTPIDNSYKRKISERELCDQTIHRHSYSINFELLGAHLLQTKNDV